MDAIKAELDELMGLERNVPLKERKKKQENYEDPQVCKYNLVSVCPHDLFPNTKMDLGKCSKRHEDFFKDAFLRDENRYPLEKVYINETIKLIEGLLVGVDSKIKKSQQKLEASINEAEQPQELVEKLEAIDEEIKRQLADSERFGDEGKIEESEACMAQVEALRKRKEEIKLAGDLSVANRHMKVCEICGAMQALNDTEKRAIAHLEGKLHTGFAILRRELEYLKKRREELNNLAMIYRKDKQKDIDREKEKRRDRSRSREKSGSRDRHSRKKHYRRSRSRSYKRSNSRDRKHKKDKKHRRRSRSSSSSSSRSRSPSDSRRHKKKSHHHKRDRSRESGKENHSNGHKTKEEEFLDNLAKKLNDTKDSDREREGIKKNDRSQFYDKS